MRTIFVNPSPSMMSNPRRRRRRRKNAGRSAASRARKPAASRIRVKRYSVARRNAGITPFVQPNPLILDNPRRRRRRGGIRNPNFSPKSMIQNTLMYGGGAAMGAGLNILALRRIENDWLRNGARIAAAILGGVFIKGTMGAAMAGATLYPTFAELALMTKLITPAAATHDTDADLQDLAADLQDVLDEISDDELYVP